MKITLGKQRRRGWVLWLFLVIVAGTIALCKALVDATNAVYPANPPPPPPAATNMPPTNCLPTNPPINLAIFIPVSTNSGPVPNVVTISFGLMPDANGDVSAMVVSVNPPKPNQPPLPAGALDNVVQAWWTNWGVDLYYPVGQYGQQSYSGTPANDGLYYMGMDSLLELNMNSMVSGGNAFTYDPETMTVTINWISRLYPQEYAASLQRIDETGQVTSLCTNRVTAGSCCTFLDLWAPAKMGLYRVAYHKL